ncbi:MAG: DUF2283 domain-containing protein [Pseudomonadales bacterium]|jgi:uncharacterized protein YuzE|nr:DUF2283 domain-containing protein [Pseudomonadales bacterium]MDP7595424.1 DUF2283 domain-containing protein [Pseudomonadales bacterium]HJN49657.1 DUF2283 domain-containing protein [Pseudomonadales bacterium]|tara:strand:+ start:1646 stop:1843 length:198 start_codon:yes stop_codon:yes gene_type:complete
MKMSYFDATDTLYIELSQSESAETQQLDENTILDLDQSGQIISITLEHASHRGDVHNLVLSGIAP